MAVTKTVTGATPYEQDGNVVRWSVEMQYEDGIEDTDSYYTSTFSKNIIATETDGTSNFTAKAKGDWTKSQIEALAPTSQWDVVFASQVDSVITNPVIPPTPDESYSIPS